MVSLPQLKHLLGLVLLLLTTQACTHQYLYKPGKMPKVEAGHVTVQTHDSTHKLRIQKIAVYRETSDYIVGPPTVEEIKALRQNKPVPGIDTVAIEVHTGPYIWDEYAVPGMIAGALLGVVVGGLVGWNLDDQNFDGTRTTFQERALRGGLIGLGLGLGFSFYGAGIGSLFGIINHQGTTDMRGF